MISKWDFLATLIMSNKFTTFCEIGVSKAATTLGIYALLDSYGYQLFCYYGIDPYKDTYYSIEPKQLGMLRARSNFKFLILNSDEAIKYINPPIDMVFIDGSHDLAQVRDDINNYSQIIRDGGIISGHDYNDSGVGWKSTVDFILKIEPNVVQDKRDENGKPNFMWWAYVYHIDGKIIYTKEKLNGN